MKLYKFQASTGMGTALSKDQTGANLPARTLGGWLPQGTLDIQATDGPRIGADSAEIIAAIERDGYYVSSAKIVTQVKVVPKS